jgi:ABC-type multidrug transport system ATPase subunit
MPAIAVEGLGMRYGDRVALRGVTFAVARGEAVALLGANGAGKTTTLEILPISWKNGGAPRSFTSCR